MADLLHECYEDAKRVEGKMSPEEFKGLFCDRCKNQTCDRAAFAHSSWVERMDTQLDRLFFNRQVTDTKDPRYAHIPHFEDMLHRAYQMELADKKGDWSVPEIAITDGRSEVAPPETSQMVERAVQALRGGKPPEPKPPPEEPPTPQKEVVVSKPPVVQPGQQPPPRQQPPPQMPRYGNIPMQGGIMVGGDEKPVNPIKSNMDQHTKPMMTETWEIPKERKIPVGGTVVLGGTKKK